MTDTSGAQPWDQPATNPAPAPVRQPRQQRKPREAPAPKRETRRTRDKAIESADAAVAAKKPREAKAKVERAAPDTIKVTLKEFAQMRVGDDAKLFLKLHGVLSAAGKASRTKVLAELSKVFC